MNRFNLGGPTYNAGYLCKYLSADFETKLIGGTPLPDEAHSGFILNQLQVAYTEIPEMSRNINPVNDLKTLLKIRKMIKQYKPQVVHTHAAKAGVLGRIAAWWCGVPVVIHTYHGHVFSGYFSPWKTAWVKRIERVLARLTTAVVTISKEQHRQITEEHKICSPEKSHIIPLGFDLDRFNDATGEKRQQFRTSYGLTDNQVAIGIIGRFAPVKNHRLFFDALHILDSKASDWRAFVIGDGAIKSDFQQQTKTLGSKVVFTSWINEMDVAMAGLDMIVMTSLNEGTPVSLIEAQAASKPVISTDVGGVRDCMKHHETGIILNDFSPESLAHAILNLINNKKKREAMGEAGMRFVNQHFACERLVSDMEKLYKKCLNNFL